LLAQSVLNAHRSAWHGTERVRGRQSTRKYVLYMDWMYWNKRLDGWRHIRPSDSVVIRSGDDGLLYFTRMLVLFNESIIPRLNDTLRIGPNTLNIRYYIRHHISAPQILRKNTVRLQCLTKQIPVKIRITGLIHLSDVNVYRSH
jgi:hypothetical protein